MKQLNPNLLTLARESRELTQNDLSTRTGVPQAVISKIEAGVSSANEAQLVAFSKALSYPQSFFELEDRVYGFNASVFSHRKRADMPAKTLRKLHAVLNLSRMRIDRLLLAGHIQSDLPLIRMSIEDNGRPETIAAKLRAYLLIPHGPIMNLTSVLEDAGVLVISLPFGTGRTDAISEWVQGHPPIILLNDNEDLTGDRMRWTLAHELGHLVMHLFPSETMEEEANKFAAEFLLPASEIKQHLYDVKLSTLALLKSIWRVSMGALLERARQLKTITQTQYRYMRIKFSKLGYNTKEPPETDIKREQPSLLKELVDLHIESLGYSVLELATLLHLTEAECADVYTLQRVSGLQIVARSRNKFA